ncbi:MAG: calcium-binding protein [Solirubrobacteraceae bacterium]
MRTRARFATACIAVAATGLFAQSAFAGDVRVVDQSTGHPRLMFTEARTPDPADPTKTVNVVETNDITITASGNFIFVKDASTPPNTAPGKNYPGCSPTGDPSTVQCQATAISQLYFDLGDNNDTFDNQTGIPAVVIGGMGTDTIINAGAGNDLISINGGTKPERDIVQSCGAGDDTVDADKKDDFSAAQGCETIKVGGVVVNQGGPPPPSGGGNPPPPPAGKPVINPSPRGTPAPVSATQLVVAPTTKPGACQITFIGTASADRIEGSPNGDKEYGLAGNDYMRGQAGDDCLYGLDGNDILVGEEGLDLLVGGNGNDRLYGGLGNDRLFGTAGNDRLSGDAGADRLSGGAGADVLRGGAGNDQLFGGLGNDLLDGGPGNDVLSGGLGRDHVIAGAGSDRINVHDGQRDVVNCGPGRDTVTADRKDVLRNCERVTRRR